MGLSRESLNFWINNKDPQEFLWVNIVPLIQYRIYKFEWLFGKNGAWFFLRAKGVLFLQILNHRHSFGASSGPESGTR